VSFCFSVFAFNAQRTTLNAITFFAVCCLLLSSFLSGCASTGPRGVVFAKVNGEPVTEQNMADALNVSHRRDNLASDVKAVDVHEFLQKLIDDRLLIQEARNWGLDQSPEIQKAIAAFILRESVTKLYNEEVVQKVSVSEEEISDYYKKNYEQYTFELIDSASEEEALKVLEQLKTGQSFEELWEKKSSDPSKKNPVEYTYTKKYLAPQVMGAISKLKPGEFSDAVNVGGKYVIIKLISRKDAPEKEFEKEKEQIKAEILKKKQKERGDALVKSYREQAHIKINRELLSAIKLSGSEREKWTKDSSPLVEVYDSVMTVSDLLANAHTPAAGEQSSDDEKIKNAIIDKWLDYKLVDHEALSRHYENRPELKAKVQDYRDQLIKDALVRNAIVAQIDQSDKTVKDYYLSHKKDFLKPTRFNVQQITVKTREEAEDLLKSLKQGADFSWLAKRSSKDSAAENGGDLGWIAKSDLPAPARELIDNLKPGETSPVFETDGKFAFIRLLERSPEEVEDFDAAREDINKASFLNQYRELFDKYMAQLRADAEIKINEGMVKKFEQRFNK
jgi:peptidyl-prolyl cis-trans isomerase C